jgi:hypothetical protein
MPVGIMRRKKGGVYDLRKLRSGAKRNEAILTFYFCNGKGVMPAVSCNLGGWVGAEYAVGDLN